MTTFSYWILLVRAGGDGGGSSSSLILFFPIERWYYCRLPIVPEACIDGIPIDRMALCASPPLVVPFFVFSCHAPFWKMKKKSSFVKGRHVWFPLERNNRAHLISNCSCCCSSSIFFFRLYRSCGWHSFGNLQHEISARATLSRRNDARPSPTRSNPPHSFLLLPSFVLVFHPKSILPLTINGIPRASHRM